MSKYEVFSGPYFPVFGLNTEICGVNTGKYGPEKTPYLDTFHTVIINGINLIFTIPQGGIVKLKSSIESVLNLKSATPKHLLKTAGQCSCCGALRDLVLFVQFKKREKHPCRSVAFSKVPDLTCNLTKSNAPLCVFFTFFKLCPWY